jgi:predicted DNA-binding protein with PD1-like motif
MLRLDAGEEIFERLTDFARRNSIRAGVVVHGIGMLAPTTAAYWNGREYAPKVLAEPHELIALHGSIAESDGNPSLHLHGALAGPDHQVVGGHLLQGRVSILAEIYVESFPGRTFGRPLDETLGLRKLDLEPGGAPPH